MTWHKHKIVSTVVGWLNFRSWEWYLIHYLNFIQLFCFFQDLFSIHISRSKPMHNRGVCQLRPVQVFDWVAGRRMATNATVCPSYSDALGWNVWFHTRPVTTFHSRWGLKQGFPWISGPKVVFLGQKCSFRYPRHLGFWLLWVFFTLSFFSVYLCGSMERVAI